MVPRWSAPSATHGVVGIASGDRLSSAIDRVQHSLLSAEGQCRRGRVGVGLYIFVVEAQAVSMGFAGPGGRGGVGGKRVRSAVAESVAGDIALSLAVCVRTNGFASRCKSIGFRRHFVATRTFKRYMII